MGLRFRKSISLGKNARLNIGKNGVGYSYGVKGLRRSVSPTGKKSTTVSIPGSGLYYTKSGKGTSSRSSRSASKSKGCGCFMPLLIIFLIVGIIGNACGADDETEAEPASGVERVEIEYETTDETEEDTEPEEETDEIKETEPEETAETETETEAQTEPETEAPVVVPEPETAAPAAEVIPVVVPEPEPVETQAPVVITYVLNTSSQKIHRPSCSSVDTIAEHNKSTTTDPDAKITEGYTWCGRCH